MNNGILPKSEWKNLSINQLFDNKFKMQDLYLNMRSVNASFSNQYLKLIEEIDQLIIKKQNAPDEEE